MALPPVVTADGTRLHATSDGPADAAVTVVLAHGWTLDARTWGPVTDALLRGSPRPPRVIRYDHRGHGGSDAAERASMTIEQLADDLAELITRVVPDGSLVLGGHSMGGMTIMALAQRHPELVSRRVAGVALVATASGGLGAPTLGLSARRIEMVRRAERRLYASRAWARRPALTRHPWLLAPGLRWLLLGRDADATAVRITTQCVAGCRPLTVSGFRPTLEAHERDAALDVFGSIPTVVLAGSRDRLTPVRYSRRIAAALPSASFTIFPEAGHMLPVERGPEVATRIAALAHKASIAASS
jgi:pimeloyl-ACP methyl ester carboxylesterase